MRIAKETWPELNIEQATGYDDLAAKYGTFPVVLSLLVVEHVYNPKLLAKRCSDALEPGGYSNNVDAVPQLSEERCSRGFRQDG